MRVGKKKKRRRSLGRGNIPRKLGCLLRLKFTMNGVGAFVKKTTSSRLAKSAEPHCTHSTCVTLSRGMSEFFFSYIYDLSSRKFLVFFLAIPPTPPAPYLIKAYFILFFYPGNVITGNRPPQFILHTHPYEEVYVFCFFLFL